MRVFVDTSAFVALAVRKDANHARAARYLRELPAGTSLVASDYVFDETLTRLRKVAGHKVAVEVGRALRGSTLARVVPIEREDVDRAWEMFEKYADKELSFTDCTSFALCERIGLKRAFTFDEDFGSVGLDVVPGK